MWDGDGFSGEEAKLGRCDVEARIAEQERRKQEFNAPLANAALKEAFELPLTAEDKRLLEEARRESEDGRRELPSN